jgi:hypothetical protein
MKNNLRTLTMSLLIIAVVSISGFAQTSAADKSWNAFWAKFSTAVKTKNRSTIKAMTAKDFSDGGGGDTVAEWMKYTLDKNNSWGDFQNSVKKGTKTYNSGDGKPWRITKDNQFLFVYKNNRWQFFGVMGD